LTESRWTGEEGRFSNILKHLTITEGLMKNNKGFSLLELLIVVAIILIIATIAIPSLLRSRQAANESAAVANLRTLNTAEVTYLSSTGGLYGDISQLIGTQLVDDTFNTGVTPKSGYRFSVVLYSGNTSYSAYATRASTNTGRYSYYSSPDAVVRYSTLTTDAPPGKAGAAVN
jgi:prepilin-type N-terminal cleavage/methylation domain-containing protein